MNRFEFSDLGVDFGGNRAVDSISGVIAAGGVTTIVGPNGCGKSTLLRCFAGVLRPTSGGVRLDGEAITGIRPRTLATRLAFLPQHPLAPAGLTVADLVDRGRDPYRTWWNQWSREDAAIVEETLDQLELSDLADRPLEALSGGQRQRAWIGMVVAQQTATVLLDEPTSFLDVAHQLDILDLVTRLNREAHTTFVTVLHDLSLAARYSDTLIVMSRGRIVAAGPPAGVLTPAMLEEVFGIEARIERDETGLFVLPLRATR